MPGRDVVVGDAADDLAARRLGEIEPVVEVGDERLEPRLERLGRADLVAVRVVRELDAEQARDLGAPRAGGVDDAVRSILPRLRHDRVDAASPSSRSRRRR